MCSPKETVMSIPAIFKAINQMARQKLNVQMVIFMKEMLLEELLMGKAIYNVLISVLTRENSKIASYTEKAPFQLKVVLIVFLGSLLTEFLNINRINICSKLLLLKKKKMIQKLQVKKMLKREVVRQLMKEKELATL